LDQSTSTSTTYRAKTGDPNASTENQPSSSSIDGNNNLSTTVSLNAEELAVIRNIDLMLPLQEPMEIPDHSSKSNLLPPGSSLADALAHGMTDAMPSEGMREDKSNMIAELIQRYAIVEASINDERAGSAVTSLPPGHSFEDMIEERMQKTLSEMRIISAPIQSNSDTQLREEWYVSETTGSEVARGLLDTSSNEVATGQDSRDLMMEDLKRTMQKLSAVQQSMSNVFNTMHENAMNPIRNIKA